MKINGDSRMAMGYDEYFFFDFMIWDPDAGNESAKE